MSGQQDEPIEIVDSFSDEGRPDGILSDGSSWLTTSRPYVGPNRNVRKSGASELDAIELSSEDDGNEDEEDLDNEKDRNNTVAARTSPLRAQRKVSQRHVWQESSSDGTSEPSRPDNDRGGSSDHHDEGRRPGDRTVNASNEEQSAGGMSASKRNRLRKAPPMDVDDCDGDKKVAARTTPQKRTSIGQSSVSVAKSCNGVVGDSGRPKIIFEKRRWSETQDSGPSASCGASARRHDGDGHEDVDTSADDESNGGDDRCEDGGDVNLLTITMRLMIPSKRGDGDYQWKILNANDSCPLCSYAMVGGESNCILDDRKRLNRPWELQF